LIVREVKFLYQHAMSHEIEERREERYDKSFQLTGGRPLISSPSSVGTFTDEVAIAEDPSSMVSHELEEEPGERKRGTDLKALYARELVYI
jgi:hypothetical protein